jgi:hypothetical protein
MLHVKYRRPNGKRAWPVAISPEDQAGFLRGLTEAVLGVKVTGNPLTDERSYGS